MAQRTWTDKQRQCLEARAGTVLVSAAAGSGKTSVLVERVIRRITDPAQPVDIDRLLIVTYTRAAAAEMRQRLSIALAEKMAAEPENPLYQRQQMLLPQAHISTVHGFCARLLQEQAGIAGLPVGFKVAEETQTQLLAAEALDTVLEQAYRQRDPAFLALATQLNAQKNDAGLREAVEQAFVFMQAQPFPHRWLRQQMDAYTQVMPLEKTPWMQYILQELDMLLESICLLMQKATQLTYTDGLEGYRDVIPAECKRLQDVKQRLLEQSYDELYDLITGFVFVRLPSVKAKDAVAADYKEQVQKLRNKAKDKMSKAAALFCGTQEQCRADLAAMAPLVEALGRLVEDYTARFTALKRQNKLLDYGDLEHECLRLLLEEDTEQPTPLAVELSVRFVEIMVDEYQDTNAAQDALFLALSRRGENLFMVGDVKQSIYGFRQAMPEIFTSRRDAYPVYDPDRPAFPATITLENNFRSRREVTDTVNFLFRQLMQRRLGGVEYGAGEELVYSAQYEEEGDHRTHWLLLDMAGEEELSAEQAEIRLIASRIRQLTQSMTIRDKEGARPLTWRDVCILLRSRKAISRYVKGLNELGIPTAAEAGGSLLSTPEIRTTLSLLRVIDNPLREVELAAVMLSPLYGFTPDDLAQLRLFSGRRTPLYTAIEQCSQPGGQSDVELSARCAGLLRDLRRYRTLAVSLPADRLLEALYRETGLEAVYAARSAGRQRVANLQQLDRIARGFEQGGFRGLSAFVRYVDRLEEQGKDLPAGSAQQQNGVRVMTVHGSKGLEFPVVFLARLNGRGGGDDSRKKLLFHESAGIGLRLVDEEELERHATLPFAGVQSARRLDGSAEELRVWYVALTRAKEQLYLIYTAKDIERQLAARAAELPTEQQLLPDTVLRAVCPGDLLLTAALRHPDFLPLRQKVLDTLPAQTGWQVERCTPSLQETETEEQTTSPQPDVRLTALLQQRLAFTYPYAPLQGVPAKLAASQLSHEVMSRDYIATARPAFLQKEGLTAAQKGTALHTFMQFGDLGRAAADVTEEVRRLLDAGFLTSQQAQALPLDKLQRFLHGRLYARMIASPQVWREYAFTVPVEAGSLADLPAALAGETVVVQGIADCVFREGDGLVLVDYKTDRVKTGEELVERYRSQLLFYQQALEMLLGLPVKQMLLYSFALDREVEVV